MVLSGDPWRLRGRQLAPWHCPICPGATATGFRVDGPSMRQAPSSPSVMFPPGGPPEPQATGTGLGADGRLALGTQPTGPAPASPLRLRQRQLHPRYPRRLHMRCPLPVAGAATERQLAPFRTGPRTFQVEPNPQAPPAHWQWRLERQPRGLWRLKAGKLTGRLGVELGPTVPLGGRRSH